MKLVWHGIICAYSQIKPVYSRPSKTVLIIEVSLFQSVHNSIQCMISCHHCSVLEN